MPRFYFDTTDGDSAIKDELGVELPNVEAAKTEAARTLAALAKDVLPGLAVRELVVSVRDETKTLLMRTVLRFEIHDVH